MRRKIFKDKYRKLSSMIRDYRRMKKISWYISLSRDTTDTKEQRDYLMNLIYENDAKVNRYKRRLLIYVDIMCKNSDFIQRIDLEALIVRIN